MRNEEKYLHCQVGPYGILISVTGILEIADYAADLCASSGSAGLHHGQFVRWRNFSIPFLGLRQCLRLEASEPANTVIMQGDHEEPLAMLAVDRVYGILNVEADNLFHFDGIHAELNALFDLLMIDPAREQMLMLLKPATLWISEHLQLTNS